ncbi:MAG: hypothetical protein GEV03_10445 [Streptosporangiales bacterium]|nr:hypothetical protein [Streptosporangiales bacterium]
MADAWLPGAVRVPADGDGGIQAGGAPRVVWHTTESDPRTTEPRAVAHYLNQLEYQTHVVWNPLTGEAIQMIPATLAARGLRGRSGGTEINREGRLCIQIEVIGFASDPFTRGPLHGLETILGWLDSWRVPRRWPAGAPTARPAPSGRSRRRWAQGGHFGHSQVPEAQHSDPGPIDVQKITEFDVRVPAARRQLAQESLDVQPAWR